MATYTYPSANIHSAQAVYNAALSRSVSAPVITLNGDLALTADIDQATADAIIADATNGSLFSAKEDRKGAVKLKSWNLLEAGYTYTRPSDSSSQGPFELSHEERHRLRNLKDDVGDAIIALPQGITTIDGQLSVLSTSADVDAIYQALIDRGVYIVNDGVNGDGSSGEAKLLIDIDGAADQAALDAIVDTRA